MEGKMNLYEDKLKEIIKDIEKHAIIEAVEIINSELIYQIPKKAKIVGLELDRGNKFKITFILGKEVEHRQIRSDANDIL
jgi:hypothetical protein